MIRTRVYSKGSRVSRNEASRKSGLSANGIVHCCLLRFKQEFLEILFKHFREKHVPQVISYYFYGFLWLFWPPKCYDFLEEIRWGISFLRLFNDTAIACSKAFRTDKGGPLGPSTKHTLRCLIAKLEHLSILSSYCIFTSHKRNVKHLRRRHSFQGPLGCKFDRCFLILHYLPACHQLRVGLLVANILLTSIHTASSNDFVVTLSVLWFQDRKPLPEN